MVDNKALKQILKEKGITAAVLDVWEDEPDIDRELVDLLDIATPHIAGYSADGKGNGTSMSIQSLGKFFNLPLSRWFAEDIPLPENNRLSIDCNGKTAQAIISQAIMSTYNVMEDDNRLRSSLNTFEKQRGDYLLRREFSNYEIKINNPHSNVQKILTGLGFKVYV